MADIQNFGNLLLKIEGIKQYMLVRNDGHIIIHNIDSPDDLSSMIVFSGLGSDAIKTSMGFSFVKYYMLTRKNKEKLLIFPMNSYFLGIVLKAEAYSPDLIQLLSKIIQKVKKTE